MPYYLLTGAGFSANWGGWVASEAFEYLLGCPEILADGQLKELLWKYQLLGGFEDALAELQTGHSSGFAQQWSERQLTNLQNAVGRMFDDMNQSFKVRGNLEFLRPEPFAYTTEQYAEGAKTSVWHFLTRFDAIFTLNQDLLLEHLYMSQPQVRMAVSPGLLGVRRSTNTQDGSSWVDSDWTPTSDGPLQLSGGAQPYVKLHGSSNWYTEDGRRVLIIGGAKQQTIGTFPILRENLRLFESALVRPKSRLMVIGYGFRDNHVNEVLERAVTGGLQMFVIDPNGAELAFRLNQTRTNRGIVADSSLETMLKKALIGGSRRRFADIFGVERTESRKILRFFGEG